MKEMKEMKELKGISSLALKILQPIRENDPEDIETLQLYSAARTIIGAGNLEEVKEVIDKHFDKLKNIVEKRKDAKDTKDTKDAKNDFFKKYIKPLTDKDKIILGATVESDISKDEVIEWYNLKLQQMLKKVLGENFIYTVANIDKSEIIQELRDLKKEAESYEKILESIEPGLTSYVLKKIEGKIASIYKMVIQMQRNDQALIYCSYYGISVIAASTDFNADLWTDLPNGLTEHDVDDWSYYLIPNGDKLDIDSVIKIDPSWVKNIIFYTKKIDLTEDEKMQNLETD